MHHLCSQNYQRWYGVNEKGIKNLIVVENNHLQFLCVSWKAKLHKIRA